MTIPLMRFIIDLISKAALTVWDALVWIFDSTAVQSLLGVLLLLGIYAIGYWAYLRVGNRRLIAVAPFRVWGSSAKLFDGDGVAAWLGDELTKIQGEMHQKWPRKTGEQQPSFNLEEIKVPAPTPVTVEYKGISPDALNSFLRRLFGQQRIITGDLVASEAGLLLLARTGGAIPWEVRTERSDTSVLQQALQEMAVRIVSSVWTETKLALANVLVARQLKASEHEDHKETLRLARLGLIVAPDHAVQHYNLGVALSMMDQFDEAISAYQQALVLHPNDTGTLNNLGAALADKGQLDQAISYYQKALAAQPDYAIAFYNLGTALMNKGQLDQAISYYQKALTAEPNYLQALNGLAFVLDKKGDYDGALAAVEKALKLKPDFADVLDTLGTVLRHRGQFEDAIDAHQKAVKLKRDHAEIRYNLGLALREAGREKEAQRAFAEAQRLDPKFKPPPPGQAQR